MRGSVRVRTEDSLKRGIVGRVGILMGGPSSEREVSLRSGACVLDALKSEGVDAQAIDIAGGTRDAVKKKLKDAGIDVAFIALHGRFGEDGAIQSILEEIGIPYTGSRVRASRLAIDKVSSRRIFQLQGLLVPKYDVIKKGVKHELKRYTYPVVVKPACEGSSVGLSIVDRKERVADALSLAFKYDSIVIIEEYIKGKEVTVGILDERPLPVVQIIPKKRFYDYEAKYTSGMTEYRVPADLAEYERSRAQRAGLVAHQSLGCRSFSRVDMIIDKSGRPYVLEINTIPGLTSTSLLPKAARSRGINFPELCLKLVTSALER